MAQFGKFPSFEAFLDAYAADQRQRAAAAEAGLPLEARKSNRRQHRDVVEVSARIAVRQPDDEDGAKHQRVQVVVLSITEGDEHVDEDLQAHQQQALRVFVAIRYGDRMGIPEAIPGLDEGAVIDLRGEWIPAERAYAIGGERLAVLHFTHRPVGFVAVDGILYS